MQRLIAHIQLSTCIIGSRNAKYDLSTFNKCEKKDKKKEDLLTLKQNGSFVT